MNDAMSDLRRRYAFAPVPEWVRPSYDGYGTVNLISSLLAHRGLDFGTPLAFHAELARHLSGKRKVILLVLDGLGWENLYHTCRQRPEVCDLVERATAWPITTVFPSTTAAAMASLLTGVPPARHGVIGYLMFFPEYRQVFNMLNFTSPDARHEDLLSRGFIPEEYTGMPSLLGRLKAAEIPATGYTYQPYAGSGLSRLIYHDAPPHPYLSIGDMLAHTLDQLRSPLPQGIVLYWSTLDTIAHVYGAASEAYATELSMILTTLYTQVLPRLDADTALVITADHGHIDGDDALAINLSKVTELAGLFRVPPAGEGRAMHLFLLPGMEERTRALLAACGAMTVFTKAEFLEQRLLGDSPLHTGLEGRIGDLIALPHGANRLLYDYQPRTHTAMPGRHGGLSVHEMVVPVLVW